MTRTPSDARESTSGRTPTATLRRGLALVGVLVLIAAVAPFVVFAVPQVVGANHGFVILSGSMEPAIFPGDVVLVDAGRTVEVGDVVTFDDGNAIPITHRVVGVEDGRYVTKGDANEDPDAGSVPPEAVLGTVSLTVPLIGYVILWVNTPVGYVALVLVPIGLLLVTELLTWARSGDGGDRATAAGPTPAIRRVGDADRGESPPGGVEPPAQGARRSGVAIQDLVLTTVASAVLLGYASWNLFTEVTAVGAPGAASVTAATAGLFGVIGAGYMTASVRLAARREARAARGDGSTTAGDGTVASASTPRPDGGTTDGEAP